MKRILLLICIYNVSLGAMVPDTKKNEFLQKIRAHKEFAKSLLTDQRFIKALGGSTNEVIREATSNDLIVASNDGVSYALFTKPFIRSKKIKNNEYYCCLVLTHEDFSCVELYEITWSCKKKCKTTCACTKKEHETPLVPQVAKGDANKKMTFCYSTSGAPIRLYIKDAEKQEEVFTLANCYPSSNQTMHFLCKGVKGRQAIIASFLKI